MSDDFGAAKDVMMMKVKTAQAVLISWELAEAKAIRRAIAAGTCEDVRKEIPWVFVSDEEREGNAAFMTDRIAAGVERLLSLDDTGALRRLNDESGMSGMTDITHTAQSGITAADSLRQNTGERGPLSEEARAALIAYKGDRDWGPMFKNLNGTVEMLNEDPDLRVVAPYFYSVISEVIDTMLETYDRQVDAGVRPGPRSRDAFPDYPQGNPFAEILVSGLGPIQEMFPGRNECGYGI